MFETTSLFDAMEHDTTQHRVASRRALALAHRRVESSLGSFLRGAQSEEEFFERLALVQPDFDGYVATAAAESEHEHPEHIAASLIDLYRQSAGVKFVDPQEEEEEDPEGEEESPSKRSADETQGNPQENVEKPSESVTASLSPTQSVAAGGWRTVTPLAPKTAGPGPQQQQGYAGPMPQAPQQPQGQGQPCRNCGGQGCAYCQGTGQEQGYPQQDGPHFPGTVASPGASALSDRLNTGPEIDPVGTAQQNARFPWQGSTKQADLGATNPSQQRDDSSREVTCPECGGTKKTANGDTCPKCRGNGKVPNFGDSMVDNQGANYSRTADSGNTDLGGPEPTMNKRKWTPTAPGEPEIEDGHSPTKRKDIIEPIPATNRDQDGHDLSEIGEKFTEQEKLPATDGDAGFDTTSKPGPAPHTKTFPNDGQTTPVTRDALSSVSEDAVAKAFSEF